MANDQIHYMEVKIELLQQCIQENRKAQLALYQQCYGILMSVCYRYEKNREEAEELLNLSFFKILTHLKNYNTAVPFEAWIRRITINTAIDEYRKKQRQQLDYYEEPSIAANMEQLDYNQADQNYDAEELTNMIRQLPPLSQKVFNLYIIDGYSHKEIGQQLQMSEGTSKWHLSNARKKLQLMLKALRSNVAMLL